MNKVINIMDGTTALSSAGVLVLASEIETWLSVILTICSICSLVVSLICRVISMVINAKKEDSDGGTSITSQEVQDIVDTIKDGADEISQKGEKNDGK